MLAVAGGVAPTGGDILIVVGARDGQPFRKANRPCRLFAGGRRGEDLIVQKATYPLGEQRADVVHLGEAQRPGPYRLERGMTVMQALAGGG